MSNILSISLFLDQFANKILVEKPFRIKMHPIAFNCSL